MSLSGKTVEEKIWNFLKGKGMNEYGAASLMGNLYAESGLNPHNLENVGNTKLGMTDDEYVKAVDNGTYTKNSFIQDQHGFGIAQWTYSIRKKALYEFANDKGTSIGDLEMQLDFLYKELSSNYKSVLNTLKTADSILEASNAVLLKYECPYDQSVNVQNKRASYGQKYYDKFVGDDSVMGYKNCTKGVAVKLSDNFTSKEFDCQGSGCCSKTIINEQLVEYLQKIREHFGKPITITSGYRCATHNRSVGGATGSRHTKGDAADIVVSGVTPREVAQYAESIGIKGIGLYETNADGHFVHIDTRTSKSFWYGQAQAYRSTFGSSSGNVASPSTGSSSTMLSSGSSGSAVKELQEKLISLGYSCGVYGADGSYGTSTANAVRKFQKDNGLDVDGIAGPNTLSAIEKLYSANISGSNVRVTASLLNVRSGAGTNYSIVTQIKKGETYEVTEEKNGWGKISKGWISLEYVEKI